MCDGKALNIVTDCSATDVYPHFAFFYVTLFIVCVFFVFYLGLFLTVLTVLWLYEWQQQTTVSFPSG